MSDGVIDAAAVTAALADFRDPETGRSAVQMDQIRDVSVTDNRVALTLALTSWAAPLADSVAADLESHLKAALPGLSDVTIERAVHERPAEKLGDVGLSVKSVIAVGSGKGGVGKSTIATSLAWGLKRAGARAGLMDADVYGPSVPHLLGVSQRPEVANDKIQPIDAGGMPVMSMGFLVPPGEAVVWRGPMLHGAVTQFLRDTQWGELDYLIIDMPPGTGDIALTLSQLLPLTGAIAVCTPQEVALLDAVKAIAMFRKVNIPVLGMVENMSGFVCPDCGKRYDIFGRGGAKRQASELQIPFLGEVPINMQIRESGDAGLVEQNFQDPAVAPYLEGLVTALVKHLASTAAESPHMPQLPVL